MFTRVVVWLIKIVFAGASWFFLALAYAMVDRATGPEAFQWRAAAVLGAVVTLIVAVRARWLPLALVASFALFFSSCVAHFHWNG